MRFTIAKPSNKMSFGDLFYTQPDAETEKQALAELKYWCDEFSNHHDKERIEEELSAIETTNNAMGVLIMYEIAELSKELGYPVTLFGMESGLYIMELLGISCVNQRDYEYSQIPSDICITDMLFGKSYTFTLAIAEPVREHIQSRLNDRFGHMKCNEELYRNISMPSWDVLEQIGKCAFATKEAYGNVTYAATDLLKALFEDICENDLKSSTYLKNGFTPIEVARLYAFARCNKCEETVFSDVRNYVFRDDVYKKLRENGAIAPEALRLARNWSTGKRKEDNMDLLKQYDLPDNLLYCYRVLGNLWSASSCLARVKMLATLKHYELKYPKMYEDVTEQY